MIRIKLALSILACLTTVLLVSVGDSCAVELSQVIRALENGYSKMSDLQADFTQVSTIAGVKREERGNGEVFLKKPEGASPMFRFNYTRPRQQIISNGRKVWFYLPENKQVMVSSMDALTEGGGGAPLSYLTGIGNISKEFSVSLAGTGRDKKGNYLLQLVPLKKNRAIAKVMLTVDALAVDRYAPGKDSDAPFPIISSTVIDPSGNRTTIDFSKVRINRGISSDRFTFKVPAGVEVVNPRQ